jgi:hypothetical protein
MLEARYLGSRCIHLDVQQRINQGSPVIASNQLPTFFTVRTAAQTASVSRTVAQFPGDSHLPAYAAAGFGAAIVDNAPIGTPAITVWLCS